MGAKLAADDSIARLAEGLSRLYGNEACQRLRQFAAENARAGDVFSAAYWDKIALIIANAAARAPHSGEADGAPH
jgi:hypothetical protein